MDNLNKMENPDGMDEVLNVLRQTLEAMDKNKGAKTEEEKKQEDYKNIVFAIKFYRFSRLLLGENLIHEMTGDF